MCVFTPSVPMKSADRTVIGIVCFPRRMQRGPIASALEGRGVESALARFAKRIVTTALLYGSAYQPARAQIVLLG